MNKHMKIHQVGHRRGYPISDGKGGTTHHSYIGTAEAILVEDLEKLPITTTVGEVLELARQNTKP